MISPHSIKKLGEVCDVSWGNTSITKASYVPIGYPAYSAAGQDGALPLFEHDRDGIVVSAIGTIGKCSLARGKWTAIKNTITVFPREGIDVQFLFYLLNRKGLWKSNSMAQPFITLGSSREIEIPLPPLPEQKRIAGILEEADRLRKLRKQADTRTRSLLPALFHQMFGDPVANPMGWNTERLGDLLLLNQSGVWGEDPSGVDDVDVLRSTNVLLNGAWVFGDVARRSLSADEREKFFLKEGDILIVKSSGSEQHIGKMALVSSSVAARSAAFANFMQRLRCDPEKLDARFLHSLLMLPTARKQILQASATTTGLRNLKPKAIDNLRIPVPPLDLQRKFSAIVTETEQQIEKQKQSSQRLEDLFQSLLHKCLEE